MLKTRSRSVKLLGAFAMVIALLSVGLVIVNQCQGQAATTSIANSNNHLVTPANGVLTQAWFKDICAGIIFLVLLAGSRFRFVFNPGWQLQLFPIFQRRISTFATSLNLNLALSRPQLGVFRI